MDEKDDFVYINHIVDAMEMIEEYTKHMKKEDFLHDKKTQDAVMREITVIGEATALLGDFFKSKYPDVPWARMKGTRNRVVHGYFSVDLNILWEIVSKDLPKLKKQLEELKGAKKFSSVEKAIKYLGE